MDSKLKCKKTGGNLTLPPNCAIQSLGFQGITAFGTETQLCFRLTQRWSVINTIAM